MGWCLGESTIEEGKNDSLGSKEKNQQKVKHADVNVVSVAVGSCHQLMGIKPGGGGVLSAPEMKLLISTGITIVHCILFSLQN